LIPNHLSLGLVKAYYTSQWHHHPAVFASSRSRKTIRQELDELQDEKKFLQQRIDKLLQEQASHIIRQSIQLHLPAMRDWPGRPPLVLGDFDPGSHDFRMAETRWNKRSRVEQQ